MEESELTNALEPILIQLTKLIETLIELVPGLLDNPVGLLILIFVVPTLFKFGFGIIGAVFSFIADIVSAIFHIITQIIISPYTITKFIRHQRKHRAKKQSDYDDVYHEMEIEGRMIPNEPVKVKSVKKTTPDQDLASSLKCNLLDE